MEITGRVRPTNQRLKGGDTMDELQHYGVKGMKWGVRKSASRRLNRASNKLNTAYSKGLKGSDKRALKKLSSAEARKKYLDDKDTKWLAKVSNDEKVQKVSKLTARDMRKVGKELKAEYGNGLSRSLHPRNRAKFNNELQSAYEEVLSANTYSVYKISPSRTKQVVLKSMDDGTIKAVVKNRDTVKLNKQMASVTKAATNRANKEAEKTIKHADTDLDILDGMFFIITTDSEGWPEDVHEYTEGSVLSETIRQSGLKDVYLGELDDLHSLQHYGIKGMKWGIRRPRGADGLVGGGKGLFRKKKKSKKQLKKEAQAELAASNKRRREQRKEYLKRGDLSDADLKKKVERLRLEVEFDKLTRDVTDKKRKTGKDKIKDLANTKVPPLVSETTGLKGKTVGAVVVNVAVQEALKRYTSSKSTNTNSSGGSRNNSTKTTGPSLIGNSNRPRKDVTPD